MRVTIDRFEGDYAIVVLDDMTKVNLHRILVPKAAKEGDLLQIKVDQKATKEQQQQVAELMEDVWGE